MAQGSRKVVYAALTADAAITVAKFVAGLLSGSAAMLAEAAHSTADTFNQIFLLVSINLSDNPADDEHPYGHGKERFFWVFLAAVFIFVAGALFSVYRGAQALFEGGEHHTGFLVSYIVLGFAFLFDGGSLIVAVREIRRQSERFGGGVWNFLRNSPNLTLKLAFFEDTAATTGLLVAAGGLGLVQVTGNALFDGLASILVGVVLILVALTLGYEARNLLLGSSAEPPLRRAIRAEITSFSDVTSIVRLLTMRLGLNSILVTGEIHIRDNLSTDQVERLLVQIDARIREAVPQAKNIYLEPHPTPAEMREVSNQATRAIDE